MIPSARCTPHPLTPPRSRARSSLPILAFAFLLCLFLLLKLGACADLPALHYRVQAIGNSQSGDPDWVQGDARALCVTGDGLCILNCPWDEAGREVGFYRDGKCAGAAPHTHGWGYHGGMAVAANGQFLFFAQCVENEGGHLSDPGSWPPKDHQWVGISRRSRRGKPAPFDGGKGGAGNTAKASFLPIDDLPASQSLDQAAAAIAGIVADDRRVFVSDALEQKIKIFDANSMKPLASFAVPHPRQIALDRDGTLWIIEADKDDRARIAHFTADGRALADDAAIASALQDPAAIACDRQGDLIVADNGPSQQIKIFHPHTSALAPPRVIGQAGGVLAPPRGKIGPLRFNGFTGVGADDAGNLYVACNGIGNNVDLPVQRTGLVLQCYRPAPSGDAKQPPALAWQLLGLEFVDCGDFDPADPDSIYTIHQHLRLQAPPQGDLQSAAPDGWTYDGCTLDRFAYPQDPRLHSSPASIFARRLDGRLLLFSTDMYADYLQIYRPLDPAASGKDEVQTFVPCGLFAPKHLSDSPWPPFQPPQGKWIWRDANGNGAFDAGEYQPQLLDAPKTWGWWVDSRGDIWQAAEANTITHYPRAGLDPHGSPIYSFASATTLRGPAPFNNLQRIEYFPETGVMYLSGYTPALPNSKNNWKTIGKVLCRYDHWTTARQKRWELHVPFDEAQEQSAAYGTPVAMSIAGDYIFIVYLKTAEVRVYTTATAAYVGVMTPPKNSSGWIDIPYGVSAIKRADGEYLVLVEEDWKSKNWLYRWKP